MDRLFNLTEYRTVLECARERGKVGEWGTTGLGGQPRDHCA